MTLKKNALLMALMMFLCCSCNATRIDADFQKEGNSQEQSTEAISSFADYSIKDVNNSVENENSEDDGNKDDVKDNSSSLDKISRLSSDKHLFGLYQRSIRDFLDGFYDRTRIIHNQLELEEYLGSPVSDIPEEYYRFSSDILPPSMIIAFEDLSEDFFTNYDLIITCKMEIADTLGIEYKKASFSHGELKLYYLYDPNNIKGDVLMCSSYYVDLIAVEKGTDVSSIEIYVFNMPDFAYSGEILKP